MSPRYHFGAVLLLTVLATSPAEADHAVMLVTNKACPMDSISMLDVRKAYFAISVSYAGHPVRGIRLRGDELLNDIFHQYLVAMSEKSYQRRLLSMALKYGSPRPPVYSSVEAAVDALRNIPCGITYLWAEDASRYTDLKSVGLLWRRD